MSKLPPIRAIAMIIALGGIMVPNGLAFAQGASPPATTAPTTTTPAPTTGTPAPGQATTPPASGTSSMPMQQMEHGHGMMGGQGNQGSSSMGGHGSGMMNMPCPQGQTATGNPPTCR